MKRSSLLLPLLLLSALGCGRGGSPVEPQPDPTYTVRFIGPIECFVAPCPAYEVQPVGRREHNWMATAVDLTPLNLSATAEQRVRQQIDSGVALTVAARIEVIEHGGPQPQGSDVIVHVSKLLP